MISDVIDKSIYGLYNPEWMNCFLDWKCENTLF